MESRQCTKCKNVLPIVASAKEIVCSFCGATNKVENKKFKLQKAVAKSKTDSTSVIAASIIIGTGGD